MNSIDITRSQTAQPDHCQLLFQEYGRNGTSKSRVVGLPGRCACWHLVDQLLNQPKGRVPAATGPEQPAVGGEKWTIMFHGESHVDAIPQGHLVTQ